ncbi:MAG: hypothetical protein EHM17_14430 [Verrucomicrobiaceae bacterium]|jgi:hypothetical protein|nr:MAG: hypothetical protein EHM17_16445 [Verrucomicrobiaceae bacterium]RPJ31987.1 MAG: hypothetical protein EHM17_14430 [Verrucomicrobiaceae bacterium]
MADSTAFGNFFSGVTGMGSPMTKNSTAFDQQEADLLNKADPSIALALLFNRKREDAYNDPDRLREQMQVYKEIRAEEAAGAAKLQAERDKRAFQYNLMASIPKTITDISSNLAQMTYNAPRLQILAGIPDQMRAAYGSMPAISVPRSRGFS